MEKTELILKSFTEKFPPPDRCAHIFKLRQDGKSGLELVLNINGEWNSFGFEPEDFGKPVEQIVDEITTLFKTVKAIERIKNPED